MTEMQVDEVEFDADDNFNYDAVELEDDEMTRTLGEGNNNATSASSDIDFDNDFDENFETLLRSVQASKDKDAPPQVRADLTRLPEVVDDFVRNFFVKHGLTKTLDVFEVEWYEKYGANPEEEVQMVPDVYLENAQLIDKVALLERELAKHKNVSKKALTLWEHVKKERDLHRMNHNRVMQEKSKVSRDLKRLQTHSQSIEPTINELRQKYESSQKEKMLLRLERDKLAARIKTLEENVRELEGLPSKDAAKAAKSDKPAAAVSVWPPDHRPNPFLNTQVKPPSNPAGWSSRASFKAHAMSVTHLSIHPKKPVVATSSDDGSWRLFSLPQGELIMSGEGHKDWVSGISIHPKGTTVATSSGDRTVKIWDFGANACKATLKGHTEGVWCVEYQETGDLLASGGLDHTARVWDVHTAKLKQTLRGHVDSVNAAVWVPYSNTLATGSGDKTVSLWDTRANFCVQTFYGHHNAVSSVSVAVRGDQVASCDAEGNVIVWDTRMIEQKQAFACGPYPANSVSFDRSGTLLAVGSDDAAVRIISLADERVSLLKGHDDAVQCVSFDQATNAFLVSCGSDATVRYWS